MHGVNIFMYKCRQYHNSNIKTTDPISLTVSLQKVSFKATGKHNNFDIQYARKKNKYNTRL